ncbi:ATP-binding protein [Clostridium culturomicium]|uniref:ATP-binding protein n=1 Tax=Clostridium culturomicium TaxID=1499683 RepID=UPI0038572E1A
MEFFLNKLTDIIIILNDHGKIRFANKAFISSIYKDNEEIDLDEVNEIVKLNDDKVTVYHMNEISKEGVYEVSNINFGEENLKVLIIKWKKTIKEEIHVEMLLNLLNQMEYMISVRDLENNYVYVNKTCIDYFAENKDIANEILKNQLLDPRVQENSFKNDDYVLSTKKKCIYEVSFEMEGVVYYYEVCKYPIFDELGQVKHIGSVLKNISLNKNMQYKILDNLKFIDENIENGEIIINNVNESIFQNFRNMFSKFLNTKFFNIWIYDEVEKCLYPKFPVQITDNNDNEKAGYTGYFVSEADLEGFVNGTHKRIIEGSHVAKDDTEQRKPLYVVNYPIIDQKEFKGIITLGYETYLFNEVVDSDIIRSICNQICFIIKYIQMSRKIADELKYRDDLGKDLEAFLEISADFVLKADASGIKDVSKRCSEILGWTKEEFMNLYPNELVHPDDLNKTLELMEKQLESTEVLQWENRVKCSGEGAKWISWRSQNLIDSKGNIFICGKDITCEKIIKDTEKEMEKVKHLEEVRNEFFANISHEFKTPINMIMTTSQLIEKQLDRYNISRSVKSDINRHLNVYKQNGYRLIRLVNNLIDITKIDSGFYNIKPINANIISIVEDIVLSVVDYCKGNNIELIFDTEVEEEVIACDPDQIERIILNLLSNAIKYTPENGDIRVDINLENKYVVIQIKDTGSGIPKEKLDVIFERFIQCEDTLTRRCEGSGIGLSLVKGLVDMHGGNIKVESIIGAGSTFEVRLPRKQLDLTDSMLENYEIKQSKIEKCSIEFADIYNL